MKYWLISKIVFKFVVYSETLLTFSAHRNMKTVSDLMFWRCLGANDDS